MSLSFENIVNKIDRCCGTTSTTYSLANKAIDVNLAQDEVMVLALKNAGWNVDDYNNTADPYITKNVVSGTRSYSFTNDDNGKTIVGIRRVLIKKSSTGDWVELPPAEDPAVPGTGIPTTHKKIGNTIFLNNTPDYSSTGGLKIEIDREMCSFIGNITGTYAVQMSGLDGLTHDYLYLKPSYEYARDKSLATSERLYRDMLDARKKVDDRYGRREGDQVRKIVANVEDNK